MSITLTVVATKAPEVDWYSINHHDSWTRLYYFTGEFPGVMSLSGNHDEINAYTYIVFDSMESYTSYQTEVRSNEDYIARNNYYDSVGITSTVTVVTN